MTAVDELVAALAPDSVPADPEEGAAADILGDWNAVTLDEASWAMRKLEQRTKQRAEIERIARDEIARVHEWLRAQTERLDKDIAFFRGRLEAFHRAALETDPKAKTITLPAGKLVSRKGAVRVDVEDIEAFVAWCETNEVDGLVRYVDPEVDKKELAEKFASKVSDEPGEYPVVTEDGEIVPGVKFVRAERTFSPQPAD